MRKSHTAGWASDAPRGSQIVMGMHDDGPIVFGAHPQRAWFVVKQHDGWALREIAILLANLPLRFRLKSADDNQKIEKKELEVYAREGIVAIYPPAGTRISDVSMQSWEFRHITSQMLVDNIWTEDELIGYDKIERKHRFRACVHFDPAILGVTQSPKKEEVELDIMRDPLPASERRTR